MLMAVRARLHVAFFTARVRTYDGRLCFHRCVSVQLGGGTRSSLGWGGYPIQPWMGGYPIQPWMGWGLPNSALDGGVPNPALDGGDTRSSLGGGVPNPALDGGYPIQPWTGGYPNLGWEVPHLISGRGVSHPISRGGYPIPSPGRYPRYPPRIASTCYGYAAGSVPLTFTQEDFLVLLATAFLFSHTMVSTGFNGSVQTLPFCITAIQLSLRHHNQMETIPFLCICDCIFCVRCNWFE